MGTQHDPTARGSFRSRLDHYREPLTFQTLVFSGVRLYGADVYDFTFGAAFGVLSTLGKVLTYRVGIRPTVDYQTASRPRLTKCQFLAAVNRTAGYTVAGCISALIAHQRANALSVGLKAGLMTGVVTAIANACTPFVEWTADHVPERRMGLFGVGMILLVSRCNPSGIGWRCST